MDKIEEPKRNKKQGYTNRILLYESAGFVFILILLWIDEILDLPRYLPGGRATPVNISESVFESIFIVIAGIIVVFITARLVAKIKHLKGLLPICASCKKIRDDTGEWVPFEEYIYEHSDADFSHGVCPECLKTYYPDMVPIKKEIAEGTKSDRVG